MDQNYNNTNLTPSTNNPPAPRPLQAPGSQLVNPAAQAPVIGPQAAMTYPNSAYAQPQTLTSQAPLTSPEVQQQPIMAFPQSTPPTQPNPAFQPQLAQAQPPAQPPAPQPQPAPTTTENPLSTQSTLQISELRDGVAIMKDGSFRAVIACQSINFELMSEQEREGVEYSYQNFLNSLSFTVQILIRSQRVDIGPYIEKLTNLRRNNDNMLLGVLMDDYINFIDILSQEANIMDKAFFIVIPYYSSADAEKLVEDTRNFFKTFSKNKAPAVTRINRNDYEKALDELNKRVESVSAGLFQIGIRSTRLNTRELSELFYNFNNPDTAVREPLIDFSQLATTYVKKGTR